MIKAAHTTLGYLFLKYFTRIGLKRHFHQINLIGKNEDNGIPVLVIANHFSWWDGFIQFHLNENSYKRRFHVMMLEEELRKHFFLRKTGAFSVNKRSRSLIETLNYSVGLLQNKDNMVLIFPQGSIQSLYQSDFHFEKGVEYIVKNCSGSIQCVFNVNLMDYHSQKKPTLNIYYKNIPIVEISSIEEQFNIFYRECLQKQLTL